MMELKEFFRLRKMGIFILNQSLKYLNPSDYATDDLILLLYFPSHKVHRKVIKLLKKHPSLKFVSISKNNWRNFVTNSFQELSKWFIIFFLIDHTFSFYYRAFRTIEKNKDDFHFILLEGLIHKEEAIQINCARVLHTFFPKIYPEDNVSSILSSLNLSESKKLIQNLKERIKISNLEWFEREDIINKLCFFPAKIVIPLLEGFVYDPDQNVRLALARVLGNLAHGDTTRLLICLLLDSNNNIKEAALESLQKLSPITFGKKTPMEILEDIETEEILACLSKRTQIPNLFRLWERKHLNSQIISQFIHAPLNLLIEKVKILYNLQNMNAQAQKELFTLEKVIISRGYMMMHFLEQEIQKLENYEFKEQFLNLRNKIQDRYTITQSTGWKILL
ncbi:MAG: HEAT repeat domain-containing protein [Candidatus Lokiarchaeota archaeon]|nr:HEAT repeat domain-containing protein [Candidatus Harpocratesius repetitus]